jgi:hypothetical protein
MKELELSLTELTALATYLHKMTSKALGDCQAVVRGTLPHFSKLCIGLGGNIIHARDLVHKTDISHDALYVRVSSFLLFFLML